MGLFTAIGTAAVGPQPSFYARRDYGNGNGCGGGVYFAIGDINNDGIPDIVCSGGQFLLGRGDGTFNLSPEYNDLDGLGLALVDLNADGNLDLIILNAGGTAGFNVAFGNGDGTFSTPSLFAVADDYDRYLSIGDFNGDGIPDVVTVASEGVWLMTGKGHGLFDQPVLASPGGYDGIYPFGVADMNHDGKLDLVVSTDNGFAILFGKGDGTFRPPVAYPTGTFSPAITVADINEDGNPDVICASSSNINGVTIYLGKANGELQTPYTVSIPHFGAVKAGDVNGDGIPDLVSDNVDVAYGIGNGQFSTPVEFPTAGTENGEGLTVVLAHLRNDKDVDIVAEDEYTRVSILLNKGNGHYIEGIRVAQPAGLSCGTELDFNQDGIADLGYLENGISFLVQYGTGKIGAPFSAGPSTAIPQNPGYIVNCPAAGDINGDGIPDLLIPEVNSASGSTILYPFFGAGGGNFTVGASITISESNSSILLADVNGDGKADLITPATDQLWYGNGDGTFQAPLQLASGLPGGIKSVAAADLNGDGVTDLVVQVEQEQSILLLSNGSGGLVQSTMADCSEHGVCYYSKYVAVGDINGDGFPDIVLGTTGDQDALVLFLNDGNGTFSFSQQLNVLALSGAVVPQVIDVNGDGLMDVVVADGVDISVVSNLGNAEFRPPVYFGEVYEYAPYYFGNWHGQKENSGLPDIAMPTSGYVTMLLNQTN